MEDTRTIVIALDGELDLHRARDLQATLSEAVGNPLAEPVIDLRHVTFIDSTALGTLLHAAEQLRRRGKKLVLAVTDGPVMGLLESSHTRDLFSLVERPEQVAG